MIKDKYKALIDGCIVALLGEFLLFYSLSVFFSLEMVQLENFILGSCIILSGVSAVYNLKHQEIKRILKKSVISVISSICFFFLFQLLFILGGTYVNVEILPLRELNNADGLLAICYLSIYLGGVIFVRILLLIGSVIYNICYKK